ncbi:MAG: Chaperone SurA [Verrucomicrobiae bacterium]|nr:Chaperone SurA [Verrucomicrobiae bacterium]
MVLPMRTLLLLTLTLVAVTARAQRNSSGAEIIDGVAAIVNDKVITYSDVREYVQPLIAQMRRSASGSDLMDKIKSAQRDALDHLIERHLILAEFKSKGYSFPDTVIDEQMNEIIATDFGGDRAAFIKTLQAESMTLAKYREQLRDRIVVQAMRNRKTQSEVVVSPAKVEDYYKANIEEFHEEAEVKLRMIVIRKPKETDTPPATTNTLTAVDATPSTADTRRQMATEILAKLDAGDSFDSLAKVYSDGKEAAKGGEWGWIKRAELRQELSESAFTLKPGQHSRVIETTDGYYILQVDDAKPHRYRPLAEVRDAIEKQLLQEQRAKLQEAWVKQLRAKAYIRMF